MSPSYLWAKFRPDLALLLFLFALAGLGFAAISVTSPQDKAVYTDNVTLTFLYSSIIGWRTVHRYKQNSFFPELLET
jgi:hypothetical protein